MGNLPQDQMIAGKPFFPAVLSHMLLVESVSDANGTKLLDYFALAYLLVRVLGRGTSFARPWTGGVNLEEGVPSKAAWRILAQHMYASVQAQSGWSLTTAEDAINEVNHVINNETAAAMALFGTRITAIVQQKRLFTTAVGRVGLGPELMDHELEDTLCLLYGATVPFIIRLRPRGGYVLIGEAYVYGLLQGEGLSEGHDEDIFLC
jgi:hypothetical protein